jgi:hypothetical protein
MFFQCPVYIIQLFNDIIYDLNIPLFNDFGKIFICQEFTPRTQRKKKGGLTGACAVTGNFLGQKPLDYFFCQRFFNLSVTGDSLGNTSIRVFVPIMVAAMSNEDCSVLFNDFD